jgi:amino acid adenylation domain-containing protein
MVYEAGGSSSAESGAAAAAKAQFRNILDGFVRSTQKFPSKTAVNAGGIRRTYAELARAAASVAETIRDCARAPGPLAAVMAERSHTTYASVLGVLAAGRGYVPLNPKFPAERLRKILMASGADVVVAGRECAESFEALLAACEAPFVAILPDTDDVARFHGAFPRHRFVGARDMRRGPEIPALPQVGPDSIAYLLFTSGSTGEPKGVAVTHANVQAYLRQACSTYAITEEDRLSQHFDLSFDLSVHDMFFCWERGASLFALSGKALLHPVKFIREHQLTMWFSVPSAAGYMLKMNMLSPGWLPSLRYSLFCGEPLPAAYAEAWQAAAPNSIVDNLYGPTEATIAFTRYRWDSRKSPAECVNGIVPIGWAFSGQSTRVVGPDRNELAPGEPGELCLAGSQVTKGYWNNPGKTREQFVRLAGGNAVWYRTGDHVRQGPDGCLYYLGRLDNQVKIRGYRVELQEIDWVLRQASGTGDATAVAWPVSDGTATGVAGFIAGRSGRDPQAILEYCRERLPYYMVPAKLYELPSIPLNANGKIDRSALIRILEADERWRS